MKNYWKTLIPSLIALAAVLVVVQIKYHPLGSHTTITHIANTGDDSLQDYYQTAQQLAPQNQTSTTTVTFLAVGDINLSRNVASEILEQNNVDYPFLGMSAVLKSTAFNFANLESPFAPTAGSNVIGGTAMTFGAPLTDAQGLKDYNFQILNSANNHAWDQGLAGIDATKSELDKLGIAHEGTGDTLDQAWMPAVVEASGIKICFVGASYGTNSGGSTAAQYVAEISDVSRLKSAITEAKLECDFVVATMHAGVEYTRTPNQAQITFAHTAIDDGADIVIGAHPHWPQTIEKYNNKYIFYSLGNFIFDQGWSQNTSEGLTLKITISKKQLLNPTAPGAATADDLQGQRQPAQLNSIELLPIIITNSQPRPATANETKNILQKIGQTENILK